MKYIFISVSFVLVFNLIAFAQVPNKISYQGLLTTSSGTPVQDGSYELQFGIYNLPSGGDLKHEESISGVNIEKGTFSVILHPPSGIFSESLYVQVTITDGPGVSHSVTLAPRSELTTAPYAIRADTAQYAFSVQELECAGTKSGIIDIDFEAIDPNMVIAIACAAFQTLAADQVVATASAYVATGGSPAYVAMIVAARPFVISGTLNVRLMLEPTQCVGYSGKMVTFAYTLSQKTN